MPGKHHICIPQDNMPKLSTAIFAALTFYCYLPPCVQAQMFIPGSFSVAASGASTYSIPIEIPPGVAGMQPQLSLRYNSQAGNGILGMGWKLTGISSITRCPRSVLHDGVGGTVNFDANDRFCLDGERLVLAGGVYGQDGSEYRTAIESFNRIRAYGTSGSGPLYFVAQAKSGNRTEYGNTHDSRDVSTQGSVRTWMSNSIRDPKGNYVNTTYLLDGNRHTQVPANISYGGNPGVGDPSPASIRFAYETDRRDTGLVYQADTPVPTLQRLTNIRVNTDRPLWSYSLSYADSPSTGRSILSSVRRCTDGSSENCLPPIILGYKTLDITPSSQNIQAHSFGGEGWQFANLFGDGRAIYWTRGGSGHFASRLNADGTSQNWNWQGYAAGSDGWQIGNILGNGRDIFWAHSGSSHSATQLNEDGSAQNWQWSGHGVGSSGNWRFVDIFGDGHPVYWTRSGATHYATRLNEDGSAQSWSWDAHGLGSDGWDFADLFGNGRLLYYTRSGSTHYASQFNADGTKVNWSWSGHGTGNDGSRLVDLFGDGRQEYWTRSGTTHFATRFQPDGTSQNWQWEGHGTATDGWQFADLFGDGRQIYWTHSGNQHYYSRLNPDGTVQSFSGNGSPTGEKNKFTDLFGTGRQIYWSRIGGTHYASQFNTDGTITNWSWAGHADGGEGIEMVNLYGDGQAVYWTRSGGTHFVTSFSRGIPDVLSNITTQANADNAVQIKYATLAGLGDSYDKGGPPRYPVVRVAVNYPVTESVGLANGIGGFSAIKYSYADLKADISGGIGILGFATTTAIETTQGGPGTIVQNSYSQSWPYIGALTNKTTVIPGSGRTGYGGGIVRLGLIGSITHSYASSPGSAGNSIFVYPTESPDENWDANGVALPAVGIKYQYAQNPQYGDITNIQTKSGGVSKTVVNTYAPANTSGEKWVLGRLVKATVTTEQNAETTSTPGPTGSNRPRVPDITPTAPVMQPAPIIVVPIIRGGGFRRPGQE